MSETNELQVGSSITGTVVSIDEEQVFVDIGQKSEGVIPINELSNNTFDNVDEVVQVGDELTLIVKDMTDEQITLSKKAVDAEKAWEDLQNKFDTQEVFETVVKEVVKGGLVVDVGLRGFIPASLVETHFVEDFSSYVGNSLTVIVADLDREQNRIILSHRAVAEEEEARSRKERLASLQAGEQIDGTVQRITDFGAFVDIGGVDGLVHISELAHDHVDKVTDVLEEGQEIKVEVLSVDLENERISLSYKNTIPGPWSDIQSRIKEGDQVEGTVKRLVDFGAFVEIEPGVEGLIHISQIANRHIATPHEVLEPEQKVTAKVLSVSEADKRISLSIKEIEREEEANEMKQYEKDEDASSGFQLSDVLGDKLKGFQTEDE